MRMYENPIGSNKNYKFRFRSPLSGISHIYLGYISWISHANLWFIPGISQVYLRLISGISKELIRHMSGISHENISYISWIFSVLFTWNSSVRNQIASQHLHRICACFLMEVLGKVNCFGKISANGSMLFFVSVWFGL